MLAMEQRDSSVERLKPSAEDLFDGCHDNDGSQVDADPMPGVGISDAPPHPDFFGQAWTN